MLFHSIPDVLTIDADQTPSKFVATDSIIMTDKGQKHRLVLHVSMRKEVC